VAYALGIDIGTTFTAAASCRDGRAETLPMGDHANAIPSVMFLREDGALLVGDAAARRAVSEPTRIAREVKRRFGDPVPIKLGGEGFTPPQLTAHILRAVVQLATEREGSPPDHVTLTYPASWGDHRRALMREVAGSANIADVGLITEPVAAAIYYASLERVPDGATIGVYDFGGGTFDAAILRKTAVGFELLGSPEGDETLGGLDFDQILFDHVAAALGDRWHALADDPGAGPILAQVRAAVVTAKETLSSDSEATIPVVLADGVHPVRITRAEFEEAAREPIERTVETFQRAVRSAGVSVGELSRVLLVGGSSRIPLVSELMAGELGAQVSVDAHPKFAVCLGAAIAAAARLAPGLPSAGGTEVEADDSVSTDAEARAVADAAAEAERQAQAQRRAAALVVPVTPRAPAPDEQAVAMNVDIVASRLTGALDVPLRPAVDVGARPVLDSPSEGPLVARLGEDAPRRLPVLPIAAAAIAALVLLVGLLAWRPWQNGKKAESPSSSSSPSPSTVSPRPHPASWSTDVAPVPVAIEGATAVSFDNKVWVIGGNTSDKTHSPLKLVQILDPATGRWSRGPSLPNPVGEAGVVTDGSSIWVIGGRKAPTGPRLSSVFRLDSPTGVWKLDTALPEPREAGAAAWDGSRVIYAGGFDAGGKPTSDVFALQDGKWQTVAQLDKPTDNFAAASSGKGTVWFFGGDKNGGRAGSSTILRLDATGMHDAGAKLNHPVRATSALFWPGVGVCLVGGDGDLDGDVECMERPVDAWDPPPLGNRIGGLTAAIAGDTVFSVGGFYRSASGMLGASTRVQSIRVS